MQRSGCRALAMALLVVSPVAMAGPPTQPLLLVTDGEFPPFSVLKSYGIAGLSTEIVSAALERAGIGHRIGVYPWLRGYDMALKTANTCLYPTFRNEEREPLFKWIGPIAHDQFVIFAKAETSLNPPSAEALKNYRIGGVAGTATTRLLETMDIPVEEANAENGNEVNLKKLQSGRIDFWAETLLHGSYIATQYGASIKPVLVLKDYDGYLACNLGVDDEEVKALNAVLRRMKSDGTIEALSKPYR